RLPCAALRATPPPFAGPYILKPRFGGSSIGIDVVADFATARARLGANPHLRAGAVIEPYREGADDINVAVRSYPELQLSAIERPLRSPGSGPILGYADKYVPGQGMAAAARECPAQLPAPIEQAVRDMALAVAELAGVRGVARVDFLLDGDELFVNELNTIPGSLSRQLWVDPPLAFGDLLDGLVAEAIAAPARRYATEGADPALLRAVGSISGKLA
ncbi:MAG: hypothetical protein ACRD0D_00205, partial [Acidimicrobiales bacterium]